MHIKQQTTCDVIRTYVILVLRKMHKQYDSQARNDRVKYLTTLHKAKLKYCGNN